MGRYSFNVFLLTLFLSEFLNSCQCHPAFQFPFEKGVKCPKISKHPIFLIVAFDGFRFDYLEKTETPHFDMLLDKGVRVPFMEAQFPTNTFPNFASMSTGLYPYLHGATDNTVFDPLFNRTFSGFDDDPEFWNYDETILPFWLLNEDEGDERYSGCNQWPGSFVGYGLNGTRFPTYYLLNSSYDVPWETKVDSVISWITDEDKPANLVYLYWHEPDIHGHSYGPDDDATVSEIRVTDSRLGHLTDSLKEAGIFEDVNIILVSDHGMQLVQRGNLINTTEMVDPTLYTRYGSSPTFHIRPNKEEDRDRIYEAFKTQADEMGRNFSVYTKEDLEEGLHYNKNRRIMDILLIADPGFFFEDKTSFSPNGFAGIHGYDPRSAGNTVQAFFAASGPLFKQNVTLKTPVSNLDIVPLLSWAMGVQEPPNNGSFERIKDILRN